MRSITYVLPVAGGSGGAHSVMQEANGLWRFGVEARVLTNTANLQALRRNYADMPLVAPHIAGFDDAPHLADLIGTDPPDVVVTTTNRSVHTLKEADEVGRCTRGTRVAYYVQDYEPLFYPLGSPDWLAAYTSYGAIPGMVRFAKTGWIRDIVHARHQLPVSSVRPSIDHDVFFPDFAKRRQVGAPSVGAPLVVAAMIRPRTPRRAPRRTARVLNRIAGRDPSAVKAYSFGCSELELLEENIRLEGVTHLGILTRQEVATLFQDTDLFVDASDYQAFGRTAVEAMSCGACAIVPVHGGARTYAVHGVNALVVDTRDDDQIVAAAEAFAAMSPDERSAMSTAAVETGYRYSVDAAALSVIGLFRSQLRG